MNCDHVFAVLTSGPFPRGSRDDADVERHLEVCPSCWRIAEALRPAAEISAEALPSAQARLLPGYHCQTQTPATIATRQAETRGQGPRNGSAPSTQSWPPRLGNFGRAPHRQTPVPQYYVESTNSWSEIARVALFFVSVALMAFVACYLLR